jgi:glycosyltransferase involved in cell wall biosynthesis
MSEMKEINAYNALIKIQIDFSTPPTDPEASVIIVAYNTNWDLVRCLDSLKKQSFKNFEILVIDNGKNEAVFNELHKYPLRYFRLHQNYKPSSARNVGIAQAKGEVVCFLDDDGVAHPNYVKAHIAAIQSNALGVRGKVIPKKENLYNHLALHYNLGNAIIISYVEMENNCSFPRSVLIEVGGFNPNFFGAEGLELSYRIFKKFGQHDRLLYYPDAIIYHDYSYNLKKFIQKTTRHAKVKTLIENDYPDMSKFIQFYQPFPFADIPWPKNKIDSVKLSSLIRLQKMIYKLESR